MTRNMTVLATALALGVTMMACSQEPPADREIIELPAPAISGEVSVEEAIERRRSVRQFTDQALTEQQISQLAWAAQGITEETRGFRAPPSAGALYPLELYLVTGDGMYHYLPERHALAVMHTEDRRESLAQAALGQGSVRSAPLVMVVAGVYARTAARYGDRAARYVHMEVGHLGQNVHLQAEALGLGSVPIGAFDDAAVADCLGLPGDHAPLYLIPVGHPR
ncbi:MAG: SagB/ThcOx family dehydrogenase [Armatimonadota bacterium]|jgi:SagB-type dehydrogenase family enzyme